MTSFKDGVHIVWWGQVREGEYGNHFFLKEKEATDWANGHYKFSTERIPILIQGDQFYILRRQGTFSILELTLTEDLARKEAARKLLAKTAKSKLTKEEYEALKNE